MRARALALAVLVPALGVAPARAAFERPPLSPGAAALGGVLAVSSDAAFGNPAAAGEDRGVVAWAGGARPFGLPELSEAHVAVVWTGVRAVGLGARRFGSRAYGEIEVRLVGAWRPAPGLAVGTALRALAVGGAAVAPRRTGAIDVALRVRPEPETEVGAVVEAVLGELPGDPARRQPRTALGLSRRLGSGLRVYLEAQRREDRPVGGVVGLSWRPVPALALRGGVRESPRALAWGFSARAGSLALDTSVTHSAPLGRTVRVGLRRKHPGAD